MINNSSNTEFQKVYKVSPNSTHHKMEQFYKGVWGHSLPLKLLTFVDWIVCGCFDL